MPTTLNYTATIPVRHEVDLCVLGGGPAGVTAAVAAARNGLEVMLVEQTGALGGLGTSGLVPGFCPLTDGENVLVQGLGGEIVLRLKAEGGLGPTVALVEDDPSTWRWLPFRAETLKRVYDDMVREADVALRFATTMTDVVAEDGTVTHAVLAGKQGSYAVAAKLFVDATGDGQAAWLAGAATDLGGENGETQGMTLCNVFANINWDRLDAEWGEKKGHKIREALFQAFEDGHFRVKDLHHPGIWRTGEAIGGTNLGHIYGKCAVNDDDLTEAYLEGRRLSAEFLSFYRKYIPGYENAELATSASLMGVRETRRVVGDYVLSVPDFEARATFEDEIGRYNYPIDIHRSSADAGDYEEFEEEFRRRWRMGPGESYGIPYRCLLPRDLKNVLVAGRCVSADRGIQGSLRVMPGCYLTGHAAGVAASLATDAGSTLRDVSPAKLRGKLREEGAYLP